MYFAKSHLSRCSNSKTRTHMNILCFVETVIRQSCANFHFNHRFNCTRCSSCSVLQTTASAYMTLQTWGGCSLCFWRWKDSVLPPQERIWEFAIELRAHAAPMKILIIASANAFPRNSGGSQLLPQWVWCEKCFFHVKFVKYTRQISWQ